MFDSDTIIVGIIVIIGLVIVAKIETSEEKQYKINMAECMKEHKEYECHAMLDNHSEPYPIIIPMRY